MTYEHLEGKLSNMPKAAGVYLMKNADGQVIYVGKAINLRNRVRSYFQDAAKPHATTIAAMLRYVRDIDYIITDTEVEALILESNLIKKHQPRYNAKLKDDKRYPYLKVTTNEPFAGLYMTRTVERNAAKYFGPFAHSAATRQTVKQLTKFLPIRTCNLRLKDKHNRNKPCLNFHIKRCPAPCADLIDKDEYVQIVHNVVMFLGGKKEILIKELREKMATAAANMDFELAAKIRDQIEAIEQAVVEQKVDSANGDDEDVIGYSREADEACVQIMMVRGGKLIESEHFFMTDIIDATDSEILTAFVQQYYLDATYVPKAILLPQAANVQSKISVLGGCTPSPKTNAAAIREVSATYASNGEECPLQSFEAIQNWLTEKRGSGVVLHVSQRGQKLRLVEMASKNADNILRQKKQHVLLSAGDNPALLELQSLLELQRPPPRIDAFDISNIGGDFAVGSCVVFEDGEPAKSEYRRFKIRTVEQQDDYAMMQEVVKRRYRRILEENGILADLILIDGGKGQLNAAISVLEELDLEHLPIIGLAKKREHIFRPDNPKPIILKKDNPTLHLIQRVRDEAHRFAVNYHRTLRSKELSHSILDEIPGIGPKRKQALLQHFGSIDNIRKATLDELLTVKNITHNVAAQLMKHLVLCMDGEN